MKKNIIIISVIILIIFGINLIFQKIYFRLDLTAEKKFTLTTHSKELLRNLPRKIYADIYLTGDLPIGFQKLRKSVKDILQEFSHYTDHAIDINFIEVDIDDTHQVNKLLKRGLQPTSLNEKDKKGRNIRTLIFPGLILHDKEKEIAVNILKNRYSRSASEKINNSVELLEYELINALRLLYQKQKKKIAFAKGHKFTKAELADISIQLSQYYNVEEVDLGNTSDLSEYGVLIILQPKKKFSENEKYFIDQYLMNGGKLLFSLDDISANQEILMIQQSTTAIYKPNNFEDQLFTYGIRINPDILLDMQSVLVPVKTSLPNEPTRFSPLPWYYEPLLSPNPKHPITKELNLIKSSYINSIDFVGKNYLKKTILLATSSQTKQIKIPCKIDLSITMMSIDKINFNAGPKPVAVLLEGKFPSVFSNRRKFNARENFKALSNETKLIVIADDDIMRNKVKGAGENTQFQELGYDIYTKQKFGNKDFILNAIEYLCDDHGWTSLRNREIKIRLLNKSKIYDQRAFWQLLNAAIPMVFILLIYAFIQLLRKYNYGK